MSSNDKSEQASPLVLMPLPYANNALDRVISTNTINFHYGKHHKAYVDNLNKLVAETEFASLPLEKIISETVGKSDMTAIFNNAGLSHGMCSINKDQINTDLLAFIKM